MARPSVVVFLGKIANEFANQHAIKCPVCAETYILCTTDNEWNFVPTWLLLATKALRTDHKQGHKVEAVALSANFTRKR